MDRGKLKNDFYRKTRGGWSRHLNIYCDNCKFKIAVYQKDGAGFLKRLYIDRLVKGSVKWTPGKKYFCKNCGRWLGVMSIYKTENRPCVILFQDEIKSKIIKI